ncbi:zinc-dependent metalloprotease [Naumannella huperziae]
MSDQPGPPDPDHNDDENRPDDARGEQPGDDRNRGEDSEAAQRESLEALFQQFGASGDLSQLVAQVQQMLGQMGLGAPGAGGAMANPGGGIGFRMPGTQPPGAVGEDGVNWQLVRDVARKTAASQGEDPTPGRQRREQVADAVRLAQSWLDEATALPASSPQAQAWSRAEWIEKTLEVWQRLVSPVASSMADAMAETMSLPADAPEAQMLAGMEQMLKPMLRTSGAHMFGLQAGQSIGRLAGAVLGGTDNGLPLLPSSEVALLPANIEAFADGLESGADDVVIYLALREAARQRLFAHAAWLGPQVLALVEAYAREITIDTSRLEELMGSTGGALDSETLQRIAEQLQDNSLFTPARTPEQERILERLETLLALVEGWVDDVVEVAAERWLPQAGALAETMRRRRGAGGPAEDTLATLVGLELRPRRVREAAQLWQVLRQRSGADAREAAWTHPDLLPSTADLADPLGYTPGGQAAESGDDLDAELAKLLDSDDEPGSDAEDR